MRPLLTICILLLTACQTTQTLPTSERLVGVKGMRLSGLRNEMMAQNLELGAPTFIRIFKEEKTLEAWVQNSDTKEFIPFKQYKICKYSGNLGPKLRESDGQAPEGFYEIGADQMNPWSEFHLSFNLGFPNKYDRAHNRTGSHLMVHGGCKSTGCYAITDKNMEEVYLMTEAAIAEGHKVPVHIFPFKMTPENMTKHSGSGWIFYWENLKQGYDAFEVTKIPPKAGHHEYKYVFDNPENTKFALF
jgi:murein L,D-transpeptidase YafK